MYKSPGNAKTVADVAVVRVVVDAIRTPEVVGVVVAPRAPTQHTGRRRSTRRRRQVASLVPRIRLPFVHVRAPLPHVSGHLVMPPGTATLRIAPHPARPLVPFVLVVAAFARVPLVPPRVFRPSTPRAPFSHSNSLGNRTPAHWQYASAPYQLTCTTGWSSFPPYARSHRRISSQNNCPTESTSEDQIPRPSLAHEPRVLRVGHRVHRQVIRRQLHGELLVARQELPPGHQQQQAAVDLVFDQELGPGIARLPSPSFLSF